MPRGRKNKSLDEKIQDTQQSIYNLEVRTPSARVLANYGASGV